MPMTYDGSKIFSDITVLKSFFFMNYWNTTTFNFYFCRCLPEETIPAIAYSRPIQSAPSHHLHVNNISNIPTSSTSSPPHVTTPSYNHMRTQALLNGQNHCYDNPVMHPYVICYYYFDKFLAYFDGCLINVIIIIIIIIETYHDIAEKLLSWH